MVETLEYLIQHAADFPKRSRAPLYHELLRSETFLLSLDAPLKEGQSTRVTRAPQSFSVWADKDPEMGGVWVPVFAARDTVAKFVAAKGLRAPKGKEYLWMGHEAGEVFGLLRGVRYFAGLRLYLDMEVQIDLGWSEVRSLSEGRLPSDEPELFDLPLAKLVIPPGVRLAFGKVDAGPQDPKGKLLCLPEVGRFHAQDLRKLVKLELKEGTTDGLPALPAALRFSAAGSTIQANSEDMLRALVGFEMYGEAEALCEWLAHKGNEAYAWVCQAAIYGKTGRLPECAALCRRGAAKYPEEKSFRINGARALIGTGKRPEAKRVVDAGLLQFPAEPTLLKIKEELSRPA